jgi:hypothetical protein
MADDAKKRGAQDRTRINMHEDYEVQYRRKHSASRRNDSLRPYRRLATPPTPCSAS